MHSTTTASPSWKPALAIAQNAIKLPQEVDLARAALCEPLAVVLKGIDRLSRT
jgi:threonine dehydrogenase-like Zn-dependent dehydrogenase